MRPLDEWDDLYILGEVVAAEESAVLEKKAEGKFVLTTRGQPDGVTKDELAKQVSAFSNTGDGFIVYGIDDNKKLDAGVPISIGSQSLKDWVEAAIPKLVYPPVTNSAAKLIDVSSHHLPGKCVLVIAVQLSERRPHWVTNPQEVAYIRAGAHSLPMRPQTFLDIASRTPSAAGVMRGLGQIGDPELNKHLNVWVCRFNPVIELLTGPPCELWSLELTLQNKGEFRVPGPCNATVIEQDTITFHGVKPLFPRAKTRACAINVELWGQFPATVRSSLSIGAAHPVVDSFEFRL